MRKITCRNGCIFVAAICLGLMAPFARGGSLDDVAAPTNALSAMWTLDNIYTVLDTSTTNRPAKRTTVFREPTAGPAATMHTLNDIMTLATNRAAVQKTGKTFAVRPYDDGWYGTNTGMAWPAPRFTALPGITAGNPETNQIRDNLTGLIWARDGNLATNSFISPDGTGAVDWTNAFNVITNGSGPVNGASYGGTNDWRLPNVRELFSLIDYQYASNSAALPPALTPGHPFVNVRSLTYWTSSASETRNQNYAYSVCFNNGYVSLANGPLRTALEYVWPVRGGR